MTTSPVRSGERVSATRYFVTSDYEEQEAPEFNVLISSGLAWPYSFRVLARDAADAFDSVVDFCEENHFALVRTQRELRMEADCEDVDAWAMENGYVCGGNHGLYAPLINIEEVG